VSPCNYFFKQEAAILEAILQPYWEHMVPRDTETCTF